MSYLDENPLYLRRLLLRRLRQLSLWKSFPNLVSELSRHISVKEVRVNMDWLLQVKRIMHVFSSLTYVLSVLLMTIGVLLFTTQRVYLLCVKSKK